MKNILLVLIFFNFLFAKTFTISYDVDYAPFSFYKEGAKGILVDIWKLWAKKNNHQIKFIKSPSWKEAILLAKKGEVDFFIGTEPYEKWMKASKTYYKIKTALFTLSDFDKTIKTIGIIGDDYKKDILNKLKNVKVISFSNYNELFDGLVSHKVDAIYDDYLALVYFAITHKYVSIKNTHLIEEYSDVKAISNNIENIQIFNEGLKNISQKEIKDIEHKWDILQKVKTENDYLKWFFVVLVVLVGFATTFLIINHRLKEIIKLKTKELRELNQKLEQKVKERTKQLELKTQEAQKAAKAKSRFLATMSHEIRTPLNSIIGFTLLLKEENLNTSAKRYAQIIENSSKSLLGIINDILDFSKIEEGKLTLENIDFNLEEEIENIAQLFYPKANEKNITFKVTKINTNLYINTDPTRLKQIILNLLSNAFKFTPENKTIELKVEFKDNKIKIEVIDEGIGIDKNKLSHIFEEFTQADNSTTRKYGGTGLGLSISYSLVKLLGGELKVESEVDKGSKFYFEIPVKKGNKKEDKKDIIKNETFDLNVLLVEDNKANQMFMKVVLKKLGLNIDIANDGVEAVEKYKNNYQNYDFILMDENMPNMTGRVATQNIRKFERENDLKPIFIIALTANALTGDREKFLKSGMDEYLSKPLDIQKLITIIKNSIISQKKG